MGHGPPTPPSNQDARRSIQHSSCQDKHRIRTHRHLHCSSRLAANQNAPAQSPLHPSMIHRPSLASRVNLGSSMRCTQTAARRTRRAAWATSAGAAGSDRPTGRSRRRRRAADPDGIHPCLRRSAHRLARRPAGRFNERIDRRLRVGTDVQYVRGVAASVSV